MIMMKKMSMKTLTKMIFFFFLFFGEERLRWSLLGEMIKKIIILVPISCVITYEFNQFECVCYKYMLI